MGGGDGGGGLGGGDGGGEGGGGLGGGEGGGGLGGGGEGVGATHTHPTWPPVAPSSPQVHCVELSVVW